MKEHIVNYYLSEKQGSASAGIIASFIVVGAFVLYRNAVVSSLSRGLALTLLISGLFIAVATTLHALYTHQRINRSNDMVITSHSDVQQKEIIRMEKVLATAYIGALILFSSALLIGIIMIIFTQRAFIKGISIGLLLFGMLGITMEMLSIKRNRQYLEHIRQLKF